MKILPFTLAALFILVTSCSYKNKLTAENIVLSPIYSSGMILQSSQKTQLSGYASPGGVLAVKIKDYIRLARADETGRWKVEFPPIRHSKPFSILIEATDTSILLKNIQAGLVFAIAGNSGIDPLEAQKYSGCSQSETSTKVQIRVFQAQEGTGRLLQGKWYPVDGLPENRHTCSFIQALRKNLDKEAGLVGIINMTRPGAQLQTWLDPSGRLYDLEDSVSDKNSLTKPFLLNHKALLDSVIYLRDSSRIALDNRVHRIWYNDDNWQSIRLPANVAEKAGSTRKKIIYLRKNIQIAPRYVNSDFTINLGYQHGECEYYFNEVALPPLTKSGPTLIHIPDTLITTYSNMLCVRLFLRDSLAGFYGDDFVCYNEDSSYFERIHEDWKYTYLLEQDFPDYVLEFTPPGMLYKELLSKLQDIPIAGIYWYDTYMEEAEPLETKLSEILNSLSPTVKKYLLYKPATRLDSIVYPTIVNQQEKTLKQVAENSGAAFLPVSD